MKLILYFICLFSLSYIAAENYTLTREQTAFFLEHPQFLAYIAQMQDGLSPDQIRDHFNLTQQSHEFYIDNLKRLGILDGKLKLTWTGSFNWRNGDEEFALFVDTTMQRQFADKIIYEMKNKDLHNKFGGFRLTTQQTLDMWTELEAVVIKYHQTSVRNTQNESQDNLQRVMFNLSLIESWKPPLLTQIKNVTRQ